MLKSIGHLPPILRFPMNAVRVVLRSTRRDASVRMESICRGIIVKAEESDRRLELLHEKLMRHRTVCNNGAPRTVLDGILRRKRPTE